MRTASHFATVALSAVFMATFAQHRLLADDGPARYSKEDLETLRTTLVATLKERKDPYCDALAAEANTPPSQVEITSSRVHFGGWIFDASKMTVAYYSPPASRYAWDFIYPVQFRDGKWVFGKLERVEVRYR
jgi:hypothetical protein